jgi:hypothetical protein
VRQVGGHVHGREIDLPHARIVHLAPDHHRQLTLQQFADLAGAAGVFVHGLHLPPCWRI